jgi:hypothetical protein
MPRTCVRICIVKHPAIIARYALVYLAFAAVSLHSPGLVVPLLRCRFGVLPGHCLVVAFVPPKCGSNAA